MLKVKSNQRLRRRYLLIKGTRESIEKAILDYLGILGWAKAYPVFVKSSLKGIVLAVNRKSLIDVRAALGLSKENIDVVAVSGTLKGIEKRSINLK